MDVFVSYSKNDQVKVSRLVETLENKGIKVWFDENQINPGDDFLDKMRKGIEECSFFLVCLSPSFEKKPPQSWAKSEFRMAILKERLTNDNSIIPVRIKSGGAIPDEIGTRAYADLSNNKRWEKNIAKLINALVSGIVSK